MRLTLRVKLAVLVGITALALLLIIVAEDVIAHRAERQLVTLQQRYLPKVELEPSLSAQLERISRGFQDAVAERDLELLHNAADLKNGFLKQLDAAHAAVDPKDAAALKQATEAYFAAGQDVSRRLIAGETGEAVVDAMGDMQSKQARAAAQIKLTAGLDRQDLTAAFAEVARDEATARSYRLGISLVCLAAVLLLTIGIGRGMLRSLRELMAGLTRFGSGDFRQPIQALGHDELGDVAQHANRMAASLDDLTRQRSKAAAQFRALLESAPDAMVIANQQDRIVFVNAQTEKLFGYPRHQLLGHAVQLLLPGTSDRETNEPGRPGEEAAVASHREPFGRRKDGSELPVEITLSPLETDEGLLLSRAIRNITERKRIENELQMSNRELEAFSYSVAHDLRAPLRGINGFSLALLEDSADKLDDTGKDYLRRIGEGATRMGQLIDALLGLARVTRKELRRESVNLTQQVEAVMKQLQASEPDRKVELVNQSGVVAQGDSQLLRALLENLLGNAWKFTGKRPEGRIAFGCDVQKGVAVYYVGDNGAGFDMAYAAKLFTPFQRLHSAAEFAGTGIGLATVQRIVTRHGGRIWAEGRVGQGATFFFTLSDTPQGALA